MMYFKAAAFVAIWLGILSWVTGCTTIQNADAKVHADICKSEATIITGAIAIGDVNAVKAIEALCGGTFVPPVATPSGS